MSSGAPIEHGTPIRLPSTALMLVNSADGEQFSRQTGLRINDANPSRIYINNQTPVMFGYMTRLALTEMNIQWSVYNVNAYNNTLTIGYYNNAGALQGVVRITVPVGFYTAPLLGKAVMDALNANATLTAFFGANTFSVTCGGLPCFTSVGRAGTTATSNYADYVISCSAVGVGWWQILPFNGSYPNLPRLTDDLTNMMGITPSSTPREFYLTLQGGYASLQYTSYIDVISNLLTKNQNVRDGTSSKAVYSTGTLARIYLANEDFQARAISITYAPTTGAFLGSTDNAIGTSQGSFRREFKVPKQIQWNNTENVDVIDISVLDYRGNPLFYESSAQDVGPSTTTVANTADLQFTIQVTEV